MAAPAPAAAAHPATKLTVLISGSGTNLQALIDACASSALRDTAIVRVISNKKSAAGLARAEKAGIKTAYHNLVAGEKYLKKGEADPETIRRGREAYDADLAQLVLQDAPDIVVCAGWMHILAPSFLSPLAAAGVPVINLHPALPGAYDGTRAIARAHEDFQAGTLARGCTGVMIHYVISEVDRGEPILVREVAIGEGESLAQLEDRIHAVEHEAIVEGTGLAIEKLWRDRQGGQDKAA